MNLQQFPNGFVPARKKEYATSIQNLRELDCGEDNRLGACDTRRRRWDAILIAYNSSPMSEIPPKTGEGSAYAPNLESALMACFSDMDITGQLPVGIPELDEDYRMKDKMLYERGNVRTKG